MTLKKKDIKASTVTKVTPEPLVSNTQHPLVFISHDTRDAELAEEFSSLLKSASAGALKSFRSSDKKGTQGIEYGQEWYPAIMDKIDEASDVVCLLTKHSVDRPWILYEAGVAKGKLDKKVIGIALGIPLSSAIGGPFAQFQNNDGDVESITKLVLELVKKVPGLDPDPLLVRQLVENFVKKAADITNKIKNTKNEKVDKDDENSVAKLFEEVKIMFDSLPGRIENRLDPESRKRKRRFHPMLMEDMFHLSMSDDDPSIGFLMIIGLYKEDFPWFYEIGMETYRGLRTSKSSIEKEKLIRSFEHATDMLGHPMLRDLYGESKESFILIKETRFLIKRILEKFIKDKKE
ncbi:TIR domain-containing protein [Chitinophaga oryziterrae]|uniref:TIR domain-containing protein n=1 Tax=Chitinophaga oryziterrae TaxID=1031224 RepID=A0A6N8J4N5_9BACT|nr:toll/interleukin-1 receptor domain-containing protein [Chitinophaga oryziterrae]MVT39122.1 TIR domain-containing protein [Chitinophaga oryziterrae]